MAEENPYPEILEDETSGIQVPNEKHRIWDDGFKAGAHSVIERVGKREIEALHPGFFKD